MDSDVLCQDINAYALPQKCACGHVGAWQSCGKILLELFVSDLSGPVLKLGARSPKKGNQETDCRMNSCKGIMASMATVD